MLPTIADFKLIRPRLLRLAHVLQVDEFEEGEYSSEHLVMICGQRNHAFNQMLHRCFDRVRETQHHWGTGCRYVPNIEKFKELRQVYSNHSKEHHV